MARQEDCSVMMALKKMFDGGKMFDNSLAVVRKPEEASVNIQFTTSIFRLWGILCPEDFRRHQKLSSSTIKLDSNELGTLQSFVKYLHTGVPPKPDQLVKFLSSSLITLTDPFIVGLIILQSVLEMGAEDCKTLQSQLGTKENPREIGLLVKCLNLQTESERKEMIMTMFSSMRESSSAETTFYLGLRQNQKVVCTMEERLMMFHWLYSMYSKSPETPPIRILLANLSPDSLEEADLEFWCKGRDQEIYSIKCHSIILMLHQDQKPENGDLNAIVKKIQEKLRSYDIPKEYMTYFIKIMYNMGKNKPETLRILIRDLIIFCKIFYISNPMELAFGRLVPDSGVNLRMFLDFFDVTEEPKYLKDILGNPLTYLTSINAASIKTKQMECLLQSDDLKMPEMEVHKLFISFAKSKACPDEDKNFKETSQRAECLMKFVRFGLIEKGDFEEVEKEKLIPVEIKMPFSYRLTYPDEKVNVPAYMHKPFVKRNL